MRNHCILTGHVAHASKRLPAAVDVVDVVAGVVSVIDVVVVVVKAAVVVAAGLHRHGHRLARLCISEKLHSDWENILQSGSVSVQLAPAAPPVSPGGGRVLLMDVHAYPTNLHSEYERQRASSNTLSQWDPPLS